jgi:hypothetical protein
MTFKGRHFSSEQLETNRQQAWSLLIPHHFLSKTGGRL